MRLKSKRSIKKILQLEEKYNEKDLRKLYDICNYYSLEPYLTKHTTYEFEQAKDKKRKNLVQKFRDIITEFLKEDFNFDIRAFNDWIEEIIDNLSWKGDDVKVKAFEEIVNEHRYDLTYDDIYWFNEHEDIKVLNNEYKEEAFITSRLITRSNIYEVELKFRDFGTKVVKVDFVEADKCWT